MEQENTLNRIHICDIILLGGVKDTKDKRDNKCGWECRIGKEGREVGSTYIFSLIYRVHAVQTKSECDIR